MNLIISLSQILSNFVYVHRYFNKKCHSKFQVTTKAATDSAGAVASSGTGSSSSGAGSSSNEDSTLIYVALGAAAFACLVAIGISIAICCMRSNASSLSQGKSKVQPKTYNRYVSFVE